MALQTTHIEDLSTVSGGNFATRDLVTAYKMCEDISKSHYENFPVGSIIVPKRIRKHFYAIYAFSRLIDDIADELQSEPEEKLELLLLCKELLTKSESTNPIFLALRDTIAVCNLPYQPFINLTSAFEQDTLFQQPKTWNHVIEYCSCSANPVGELVLRLFGEFDKENGELSEHICTALQLVNFWQDLSVDIARRRFYIPKEEFLFENGSQHYITDLHKNEQQKVLDSAYSITESYFQNGKPLLTKVKNLRLKFELGLTFHGGYRMFKKVRKLQTQILEKRPTLNFFDVFVVILHTVATFRL